MISFTFPWPLLKTPHDGEFPNAEVHVYDLPQCPLVVGVKESDGVTDLAFFHIPHRLFTMNPGLREEISKRMKAYTLVKS